MAKKILKGIVVSKKMNKTIVVIVGKTKENAIYKKKYKVSKKYKVHDEKNEAVVGEMIKIVETSPISKEKRWTILPSIIKKEKKELK